MIISVILTILCVIILLAAICCLLFRDLMFALVSYAVFGLVLTVIFYLLDAPDVAIAEASIGAALTVCIFVLAMRLTRRREE